METFLIVLLAITIYVIMASVTFLTLRRFIFKSDYDADFNSTVWSFFWWAAIVLLPCYFGVAWLYGRLENIATNNNDWKSR